MHIVDELRSESQKMVQWDEKLKHNMENNVSFDNNRYNMDYTKFLHT